MLAKMISAFALAAAASTGSDDAIPWQDDLAAARAAAASSGQPLFVVFRCER